MTRPIRGEKGQFAGSIGEGKSRVPTASDLPAGATLLAEPELASPGYDDLYAVFALSAPSASPDPGIDAYVAAAEARLAAALAARDAAATACEAAAAAAEQPIPVLDEEEAELARRAREYDRLASAGSAAVTACREHAERLYADAGVPGRYAAFYAGDVVANALRGREANPAARSGWWRRPVEMPRMLTKVRYAARTSAAVEAAKSDERYLAACREVRAVLDQVDSLLSTPVPRDEAAHRQRIDRLRARYHAYREAEQAEAAVVAAREGVVEAHARRDAGVPASGVRTGLRNDRLRGAPVISRNPDGSTNAWVWAEPDRDHPDGRYLPVIGVRVSAGTTRGNALVTADGRSFAHIEHWFRGPGDGFNQSPTVVIAPPAAGATPLDAEGLPGRGYHAVIDTTD